MNYYPNYYNPYQFQPQQVVNNLNGRIVENQEVVKTIEVPIGGYGIFPKADLSEIYIKTWNNNGTTNIITFKPTQPVTPQEVNPTNTILEQLQLVNSKLDGLMEKKEVTSSDAY